MTSKTIIEIPQCYSMNRSYRFLTKANYKIEKENENDKFSHVLIFYLDKGTKLIHVKLL